MSTQQDSIQVAYYKEVFEYFTFFKYTIFEIFSVYTIYYKIVLISHQN